MQDDRGVLVRIDLPEGVGGDARGTIGINDGEFHVPALAGIVLLTIRQRDWFRFCSLFNRYMAP
ncbi:MAG: hypothetical protein ABSB80_04255 [Methanoregula sp.]|jgi:hypothetical protein|uniref:hypothetical protein n=1 Tax=Methanoregula sp. TaxID=2052170 RepID=UPI003D0B1971